MPCKRNLLNELAVWAVMMAAFVTSSFAAKKDAKSYPEEGKIVATGLTGWVINSQHQYAHTYTVASNGKNYVLECSHKPLFGKMGEECGGAKKLQIGDVIRFRVDKERVYIPITNNDNSAGEEKLVILSTSLSSDGGAEKSAPASDAKPPAEKN